MVHKEKFYTNSPNGRLEAVFSTPDRDPLGVLLCLHGGPGGDLTGNTGIFNDIAELAADMGFATVQFSFYGSGESDGTQRDISIKRHLEDYRHMVTETRARFKCPLHIIGESAGCTIASQQWLDDVQSYVMLWPAFDLSDSDLRDHLTDDWHRKAKEEGYIQDGALTMSLDLINELRTIDFDQAFELPRHIDFFIAHGRDDVEVPHDQSLRAAGQASGRLQFFSHPKADHGFKNPEHRADLLKQLTAWLKVHTDHG